MQIVINVSDKVYKSLKNERLCDVSGQQIVDMFQKAIILPKGHGRLIDADGLRCENSDFDTHDDYGIMYDEINNAPTILESDGDSNEDNGSDNP